MNKKAFLLAEETLKIIIALIAIGFLIYFLTSLYFNSINAQKRVEAEASLTRISDVIDNKQISIEDVTDITPHGWRLFSFVEEEKPNSCAGESCLCICPNALFNQAKKCGIKGVCEIVANLEDFGEIKIKKPSISVQVSKSDNKIIITEK